MLRKYISLFTLTCFIVSFIARDAVLAAAELRYEADSVYPALQETIIPLSAGKITDAWTPARASRNLVVINIQDLHCHPEVQRNISKIIRQLDKKYHLPKVYVEGGYGDIDTSWLCNIKDTKLKNEILEGLIDSGRLTGTEYYSAMSDRPHLLKGIEDRELHRRNIARLSALLAKKEYFEKQTKELERDLSFMEARYFSPRNKKFNTIIERYRSGGMPPEKYYRLLIKYAERMNADPEKFNSVFAVRMENYPNLAAYVALASQEKQLNYRNSARQLRACIEVLKQRLPYDAYSALLQQTENFTCQEKLARSLRQMDAPCRINIADTYPALNAFLLYIEKSRDVNPVALVSEEKRLAEEIRIGLSADISEREISFLSDFYGYFKDYLLNTLSAEDHAYFTQRFARFRELWDTYAFRDRIGELAADFPLLDEYYRVNCRRNYAFLDNIPELKDNDPADILLPSSLTAPELLESAEIVTVVTGGFHTEGLQQLLKKRNIPYITLTPAITTGTAISGGVYSKLIKEQSKYEVTALAPELLSQAIAVYRVKAIIETGRGPEEIAKIQDAIAGTGITVSLARNKVILLRRDKPDIILETDRRTHKVVRISNAEFLTQPLKAALDALEANGRLVENILSGDVQPLLADAYALAFRMNWYFGYGPVPELSKPSDALKVQNRYGISAEELFNLPEYMQRALSRSVSDEESFLQEVQENQPLQGLLAVKFIRELTTGLISTEDSDESAPQVELDHIFPIDLNAALPLESTAMAVTGPVQRFIRRLDSKYLRHRSEAGIGAGNILEESDPLFDKVSRLFFSRAADIFQGPPMATIGKVFVWRLGSRGAKTLYECLRELYGEGELNKLGLADADLRKLAVMRGFAADNAVCIANGSPAEVYERAALSRIVRLQLKEVHPGLSEDEIVRACNYWIMINNRIKTMAARVAGLLGFFFGLSGSRSKEVVGSTNVFSAQGPFISSASADQGYIKIFLKDDAMNAQQAEEVLLIIGAEMAHRFHHVLIQDRGREISNDIGEAYDWAGQIIVAYAISKEFGRRRIDHIREYGKCWPYMERAIKDATGRDPWKFSKQCFISNKEDRQAICDAAHRILSNEKSAGQTKRTDEEIESIMKEIRNDVYSSGAHLRGAYIVSSLLAKSGGEWIPAVRAMGTCLRGTGADLTDMHNYIRDVSALMDNRAGKKTHTRVSGRFILKYASFKAVYWFIASVGIQFLFTTSAGKRHIERNGPPQPARLSLINDLFDREIEFESFYDREIDPGNDIEFVEDRGFDFSNVIMRLMRNWSASFSGSRAIDQTLKETGIEYLSREETARFRAILGHCLDIAARDPGKGIELVERVAMLQALQDAADPNEYAGYRLPAEKSPEGEYWDLAAGLNAGIFLKDLDPDTHYRFFDASHYVTTYLNQLKSLWKISNVTVEEEDIMRVRRPEKPLGVIRVKNVPAYVEGFPRKLGEMTDWVTEGGKIIVQSDPHEIERISITRDYAELAHKLISEGWAMEYEFSSYPDGLDTVVFTRDPGRESRSWNEYTHAVKEKYQGSSNALDTGTLSETYEKAERWFSSRGWRSPPRWAISVFFAGIMELPQTIGALKKENRDRFIAAHEDRRGLNAGLALTWTVSIVLTLALGHSGFGLFDNTALSVTAALFGGIIGFLGGQALGHGVYNIFAYVTTFVAHAIPLINAAWRPMPRLAIMTLPGKDRFSPVGDDDEIKAFFRKHKYLTELGLVFMGVKPAFFISRDAKKPLKEVGVLDLIGLYGEVYGLSVLETDSDLIVYRKESIKAIIERDPDFYRSKDKKIENGWIPVEDEEIRNILIERWKGTPPGHLKEIGELLGYGTARNIRSSEYLLSMHLEERPFSSFFSCVAKLDEIDQLIDTYDQGVRRLLGQGTYFIVSRNLSDDEERLQKQWQEEWEGSAKKWLSVFTAGMNPVRITLVRETNIGSINEKGYCWEWDELYFKGSLDKETFMKALDERVARGKKGSLLRTIFSFSDIFYLGTNSQTMNKHFGAEVPQGASFFEDPDNATLDCIAMLFSARATGVVDRRKEAREILKTIRQAPESLKRDIMTEITLHKENIIVNASSNLRFLSLSMAIVNIISGNDPLSPAPIPEVSRIAGISAAYFHDTFLSYQDPAQGGKEWVPQHIPSFTGNPVLSPRKSSYRWLDIGSAPFHGGSRTLNSLKEICDRLLGDGKMVIYGSDIFFPPYFIENGEIKRNEFIQRGFDGRGEIKVNGITYLDSNREGNNVLSPAFMRGEYDRGRFDFISAMRVMHYLAGASDTIEKRLLANTVRFVDENGKAIAPRYSLAETQVHVIERMLSLLAPGGILFLDLPYGTPQYNANRNDTTVLVIQKIDDSCCCLYGQVIPFIDNEPFDVTAERFLIDGWHQSPNPANNSGGIRGLYPDVADDVLPWLLRANILVCRYRSRDNNVWAQMRDAIECINQEKTIAEIFQAYLSHVPDAEPLKNRIIAGIYRLEHRSGIVATAAGTNHPGDQAIPRARGEYSKAAMLPGNRDRYYQRIHKEGWPEWLALVEVGVREILYSVFIPSTFDRWHGAPDVDRTKAITRMFLGFWIPAIAGMVGAIGIFYGLSMPAETAQALVLIGFAAGSFLSLLAHLIYDIGVLTQAEKGYATISDYSAIAGADYEHSVFVFDWDNTLFSWDMPLIFRAVIAVSHIYGDFNSHYMGDPVINKLRDLLRDYTAPAVYRYYVRKEKEAIKKREYRITPGATDILRKIVKEGGSIGIVTNRKKMEISDGQTDTMESNIALVLEQELGGEVADKIKIKATGLTNGAKTIAGIAEIKAINTDRKVPIATAYVFDDRHSHLAAMKKNFNFPYNLRIFRVRPEKYSGEWPDVLKKNRARYFGRAAEGWPKWLAAAEIAARGFTHHIIVPASFEARRGASDAARKMFFGFWAPAITGVIVSTVMALGLGAPALMAASMIAAGATAGAFMSFAARFKYEMSAEVPTVVRIVFDKDDLPQAEGVDCSEIAIVVKSGDETGEEHALKNIGVKLKGRSVYAKAGERGRLIVYVDDLTQAQEIVRSLKEYAVPTSRLLERLSDIRGEKLNWVIGVIDHTGRFTNDEVPVVPKELADVNARAIENEHNASVQAGKREVAPVSDPDEVLKTVESERLNQPVTFRFEDIKDKDAAFIRDLQSKGLKVYVFSDADDADIDKPGKAEELRNGLRGKEVDGVFFPNLSKDRIKSADIDGALIGNRNAWIASKENRSTDERDRNAMSITRNNWVGTSRIAVSVPHYSVVYIDSHILLEYAEEINRMLPRNCIVIVDGEEFREASRLVGRDITLVEDLFGPNLFKHLCKGPSDGDKEAYERDVAYRLESGIIQGKIGELTAWNYDTVTGLDPVFADAIKLHMHRIKDDEERKQAFLDAINERIKGRLELMRSEVSGAASGFESREDEMIYCGLWNAGIRKDVAEAVVRERQNVNLERFNGEEALREIEYRKRNQKKEDPQAVARLLVLLEMFAEKRAKLRMQKTKLNEDVRNYKRLLEAA